MRLSSFGALVMGLRSSLALLAALGLTACSSALPVTGAVDSADQVAAQPVPAPKPVSSKASKSLRCKTVLGEVEGFGKESVRSTAEQSRLRAVAEEKSHRTAIGQTVASVDLEETECVAVYPIGAEEWHCMARAKVCALPAT